MKRKSDPGRTLNPGVFFAPAFRVPGARGAFRAGFPLGVRVLRGLYGSPLSAPLFRALVGASQGHGAPARSWRSDRVQAADLEAVEAAAELERAAAERLTPERLARAARGCVNCGECNSVCPVFDDSGIRLPQMLTHIGERLEHGAAIAGTEQLLLDLCMRCGNCQQVCQADIPHLPLYAALEQRAGALDDPRRERHVAILASLRHSERYRSRFLQLRPGGYVQRTPASLPGEVRFVLFRTENDAGPADTCIHCGACVPVCPTAANEEFRESADPRRITTDLNRCIGCGTCVEVCPANLENGGRTLRVMEAPSREFFDVCAAFEGGTGRSGS
jgi:ferredoxin